MPVARWRGRDCGRSMTSVSSSKREKTRAWASPTPAGQYLAKNSQGLHQRRTRPPYRSCSSQRQGSPLWTFCEEISADRDRSEANRQPGSCVRDGCHLITPLQPAASPSNCIAPSGPFALGFDSHTAGTMSCGR